MHLKSDLRQFFLELAGDGLRMPIGTDLVLQERPDPEAILHDGEALGRVLRDAAERYAIPLAVPLMDLRLEKMDLLRCLGFESEDSDRFHFHEPPENARLEPLPFGRRNQAHIESIQYVAEETSLVPVGMAIGPFSLTTKLIADPITLIAMAGAGLSAGEDEGVRLVERCLELAEAAVARSVQAQLAAGARAILICEPAANRMYLSPKQIQAGADIFDRYVIEPNLRLKELIESAGAVLIFHNCGDLTDHMVAQFAVRLHPAVLSLGSSRQLWDDARMLPRDVVLFGNLPTKLFYSDDAMPDEKVRSLTCDLIARMSDASHPFILGSECDVLHVADAADAIRRKLQIMLHA